MLVYCISRVQDVCMASLITDYVSFLLQKPLPLSSDAGRAKSVQVR